MTTTVIRVRGTKEEVKERIRELARNSLGKTFRSNLVYEYLKIVQESYDAKSEGNIDQFGQSWKPLKPATIAARPISPTDRTRYKLGTARRERGLLTESQNKRWKGIFYQKFRKLVETLPLAEAKAQAAQYAWSLLKSQGARTRIGTLGNRKVPIMKDTYELYNACCPGRISGEDYEPPKNQTVEDDGKTISITIEVDHAEDAMLERPVFPPERAIGLATEKALETTITNFRI